jgi:hypothetical protein
MTRIALKTLAAAAMIAALAGGTAEASKHHPHRVMAHKVMAHKDNGGWTKVPDPKPGDPRGWHNGVCSYDCDDAESPGSGYRCRHITMMGSTWRECVK